MSADQEKVTLCHNIAYLDVSDAREGPMVAYRWNDELSLTRWTPKFGPVVK